MSAFFLRIPRPSWQLRKACTQEQLPLFFAKSTMAARRICADCPVVQECSEWALADAGLEGVLGGMTVAERDEIRARRRARSIV